MYIVLIYILNKFITIIFTLKYIYFQILSLKKNIFLFIYKFISILQSKNLVQKEGSSSIDIIEILNKKLN